MSKWRNKLARLPSHAAPPKRPESAEDAGRRMAALREKLQAMVGGRAAPPPASERLPFERQEEAHGAVYSYLERYSADERVGRAVLGDEVDIAMLAQLALTPELEGCSPQGALFLDTETTGFGTGTGNLAFLVGMAWYRPDGGLELEQCLLRDPNAEAAMIERIRQRVQASEYVVSYNGKAFDLPVLRGRCVMTRLPPPASRPHLDLLHLARRVHRHETWSKTLKVLEREVLRFDRGHDVGGAEVAQRYGQYLRSGSEDCLREVVEHNRYDVLSLAALMVLYGQPLAHLAASELAAVARVMKRSGDLSQARAMADIAVERGAGPVALRIRGETAKAQGRKLDALADFEELAAAHGDTSARLEVAMIYEHFLREPGRALAQVELGTSEDAAETAHRRARLVKKLSLKRQRNDITSVCPLSPVA